MWCDRSNKSCPAGSGQDHPLQLHPPDQGSQSAAGHRLRMANGHRGQNHISHTKTNKINEIVPCAAISLLFRIHNMLQNWRESHSMFAQGRGVPHGKPKVLLRSAANMKVLLIVLDAFFTEGAYLCATQEWASQAMPTQAYCCPTALVVARPACQTTVTKATSLPGHSRFVQTKCK